MDSYRNLSFIHGWKVGESDRNLVMFMKGEEAAELKISLTISKSGKGYFVGRLLGSASVANGEEYVGVNPPTILDSEKLKLDAQMLGLKVVEEPLIYVVAG